MDHHWGRIFAGAALTTLRWASAPNLAAPENRQDGDRIIAGRDARRTASIRSAER
ncbi:hypothetical protein M8494_22985 [Serratia ureilytica]